MVLSSSKRNIHMQPMVRTYKAGSCLFHENDRSRELYIIQSGTVRIYRRISNRDIELAVLVKGSVLGEMSLIDGKPRSATAQAVEDCSAIVIDSDTFFTRVKDVPSWFMSIVRMTSQKVRKANERLKRVQGGNHGANIVFTLNYLLCRYGAPQPECAGAQGMPLGKTKRILISLLGVNSQRVDGLLAFLSQSGIIDVCENSIGCKDPARLEEYCLFLRMLCRKMIEKLAPLGDDARAGLLAIAEKSSMHVSGEDHVLEIPGDVVMNALGGEAAKERAATVLSELKEASLISQKGTRDEKAGNPYAGCVFSINSGVWSRYVLSFRYNTMVPAA